MLVTIYGKEKCGYCDAALNLCDDYDLPFIYRQLDKHYDIEDFARLFPEGKSFPQILINDIHIGGYNDFEEVMEMASE